MPSKQANKLSKNSQ